MSVAERLEKALEFLKANEWGQVADKQETKKGSGVYAYCARGVVVYGAFADEKENIWCATFADWHKGECVDNDGWTCGNNSLATLAEFAEAMDALDVQVREVDAWNRILTAYNDDPYRTKDDVIALFGAAIEKAKEVEAK